MTGWGQKPRVLLAALSSPESLYAKWREDDTCFNEHAQRSEKLSPQVKPTDLQYQLVLMKVL